MRRRHDHPFSIEMCLDERRVNPLQATNEHLARPGKQSATKGSMGVF